MLPSKNQPEYFFTLYLENLFLNNTSPIKIAICTNGNRAKGMVLNPDYNYIYTGNTGAVSISKTLDSNPTSFSEIPTGVISNDIIRSRQLIGTDCRLTMSTYLGLVLTETTVFTGIVSTITASVGLVSMELTSKNEKLKLNDRYKTSVNCLNTIGEAKCTLSKQSQTLTCFSVTNNNLILTNISTTFQPNDQYEIIIGTTRYLVDKTNSSLPTIAIHGVLEGLPQKITLQRHCNKTITQCGLYNNLTQFNGNPFLKSEGLNINL